MKLAIVDYGVGNLKSLQNALKFLGFIPYLADRPKEVVAADKLILPGVGAFGYAMRQIRDRDLEEALQERYQAGIPILGICLGMQLLLSHSEENGSHAGLGFIQGQVKKLQAPGLKVPHMGWNSIRVRESNPLISNLPASRFGYFVHSYVCNPDDAKVTVATTPYGADFCSILAHENVFGTQFHPEKSQTLGLRILQNFGES